MTNMKAMLVSHTWYPSWGEMTRIKTSLVWQVWGPFWYDKHGLVWYDKHKENFCMINMTSILVLIVKGLIWYNKCEVHVGLTSFMATLVWQAVVRPNIVACFPVFPHEMCKVYILIDNRNVHIPMINLKPIFSCDNLIAHCSRISLRPISHNTLNALFPVINFRPNSHNKLNVHFSC